MKNSASLLLVIVSRLCNVDIPILLMTQLHKHKIRSIKYKYTTLFHNENKKLRNGFTEDMLLEHIYHRNSITFPNMKISGIDNKNCLLSNT